MSKIPRIVSTVVEMDIEIAQQGMLPHEGIIRGVRKQQHALFPDFMSNYQHGEESPLDFTHVRQYFDEN